MLHGGLETVPSLHSSFDFLSFDNQTCKKTCTVRVFSRALQGSLRQALRKHCGDSWPSQLLSTFGLQRKDGVDANVLQSALRWDSTGAGAGCNQRGAVGSWPSRDGNERPSKPAWHSLWTKGLISKRGGDVFSLKPRLVAADLFMSSKLW